MEENKNLEKENPNTENKTTENNDKRSKAEKIFSLIIKTILNLIYAILAIIVIILIYNIIQVSILNKPYMNILGYSFFQVKTGSMSGTIEVGDIIVVKLTKEVSENDIITYEKDKMLITHRIIEKQGDILITKGDANNTADKPIITDEIVGKVVYTLKNVEVWKQVFKTQEIYILVIITLVLFGITISIGEKNKE